MAGYTLQLTDGSDVQEFSVTDTRYIPATDLATGVYTWSVKAHDSVDNVSDYVTPAMTFEIADRATSIYLPVVVKN